MHLLWLASTLFTLWMLVDAIKRGVAGYWYCVILCPLGEFAYFFAVKIHDFHPGGAPALLGGVRPVKSGGGLRLFAPAPPSIDELRYRVGQNSCIENRLDLARGLYDLGEYEESAGLLEQVLRQDDSYAEAFYGLARCRLAMNDATEAERCLRKVLELERSFYDYGAWAELAQVVARAGRTGEAIELLEGLFRARPRIGHALLLARLLVDDGCREEAAQVLEAALEDQDHAPRHVQRLNRDASREARELLVKLS